MSGNILESQNLKESASEKLLAFFLAAYICRCMILMIFNINY